MHQTLKQQLESLYKRYNRREYVHPDPLEFLYRYSDPGDRELVGIVASALAYGRVKQILASVSNVLDRMGSSPLRFIMESSDHEVFSALQGFVHRFSTGEGLARLFIGLRSIVKQYGSLQSAFQGQSGPDSETVLPALNRFCRQITDAAGCDLGHLVPLPERGSACKRMNLFLRWMVRKDAVDPGGWNTISTAGLIVPLDVHMHRIGRKLGFTSRKQADMQTALQITAGFRRLVPNDPVRYDFVLTRLGIRKDMRDDGVRPWTLP